MKYMEHNRYNIKEYKTKQNNTMPCNTIQLVAMQNNALPNNTIQFRVIQYNE